MISRTKAKGILGCIFGIDSIQYDSKNNQIASGLKAPASVYIGMCSEQPNHAEGNLKEDSEPSVANGYQVGYKRQLVSGVGAKSDTVNTQGYYPGKGDTKLFGHADDGVIENKEEIQFNTAISNYPKIMKYWFLSESQTGPAFIWGSIKDILYPQTNDNVITETIVCDLTDSGYPEGNALIELNGKAYAEIRLSDPFIMNTKADTQYIVTWGSKDYIVKPRMAYDRDEEDGKILQQYVHLGNASADSQTTASNDTSPFFIRYSIERRDDKDFTNEEVGIRSADEGILRIYSFDADDYLADTQPGDRKHEFGLYGEGINIPVATVPTFYPKQLRASLDVEL